MQKIANQTKNRKLMGAVCIWMSVTNAILKGVC